MFDAFLNEQKNRSAVRLPLSLTILQWMEKVHRSCGGNRQLGLQPALQAAQLFIDA